MYTKARNCSYESQGSVLARTAPLAISRLLLRGYDAFKTRSPSIALKCPTCADGSKSLESNRVIILKTRLDSLTGLILKCNICFRLTSAGALKTRNLARGPADRCSAWGGGSQFWHKRTILT